MKNFKKILVLALAVMMCLTALAVPTFAATFDTEIKITARFNETGDKIIASVVTTKPAGAIQGTLTYSGLTFDADSTKFYENNDMDKYVPGENQVKFVLLANDLTKGDTHWADFYFNLPEKADENAVFTFGLTGVQACDVDEKLTDDAITVDDVTLTLTANDLTTLGAQYRATTPALRFGTRLSRTQGSNELKERAGATAVRCGFLAGFEFKLDGKELTATLNENGMLTEITPNAIDIKAKKCLADEDFYLIYTYAVTGFEGAEPVDVDGVSKEVKDLPIVARPYVVYKDASGNYNIDFGATVSKSYADVKATSDLLVSGPAYGN